MDDSALKALLDNLDTSRSSLHGWLHFWTFLVVLGVALEVVFVVKEYIDQSHDFGRGIVHPPEKPSTMLFVLGLLGAGLVAIGVAGELSIDVQAGKVETEIRKANELRVALLSKEAGDAKTSADGAALAASRAKASADEAKHKTDAVSKQSDALTKRMENASRQLGHLEKNIVAQGPRSKLLAKVAPKLVKQLAPFAGQRIGLFVCGQQGLADQETLDTWAAIANILDTDGAKWKLAPTNLNFVNGCGAAKGLGQGVLVFAGKRASKGTMEAATLLGGGLVKTLPPSPFNMFSLVDPAFAKMLVERGFQDKNTPWVSPGLDPDLITVVIGGHP